MTCAKNAIDDGQQSTGTPNGLQTSVKSTESYDDVIFGTVRYSAYSRYW